MIKALELKQVIIIIYFITSLYNSLPVFNGMAFCALSKPIDLNYYRDTSPCISQISALFTPSFKLRRDKLCHFWNSYHYYEGQREIFQKGQRVKQRCRMLWQFNVLHPPRHEDRK